MNWKNYLLENYFVYVGEWRSCGDNHLPPNSPLLSKLGVLALTLKQNDEVVFIGETVTRSLRERLGDFTGPHPDPHGSKYRLKTKDYVNVKIRETMHAGQRIELLVCLNEYTDLKSRLLRTIKPRPSWNRQG